MENEQKTQHYTLVVQGQNMSWRDIAKTSFVHLFMPIIIPVMLVVSKLTGQTAFVK